MTGVSTYDNVFAFIPLLREVQIVANGVIASPVERRERNLHVEFTPSLLVDLERRLLECLARFGKGGMELVGSFLEDGRRHIFLAIVEEPDFYAPTAHREAFHLRGFVARTLSAAVIP